MQYAATIKTVRAMGRTFKRVVVAHINLEGTDFYGNRVQSFAPRFVIAQSGDYREAPKGVPADLERTLQYKRIDPDQLRWS